MTDISHASLSRPSGVSPSETPRGRRPAPHGPDAIPTPEQVRTFEDIFPETDANCPGTAKTSDRASSPEARDRAAHTSEFRPEIVQEEDGPEKQSPLGMTHPLNALLTPPPAVHVKNAAESSSPDTVQQTQILAERLAETILVGQRDGAQEVRISVSPDVLPDTEILLSRRADGSLNASLLSDNRTTFQVLVAGQQDLRARLELLSTGPVQVTVDSRHNQSEDDMRRRSRGLDALDTEMQD